MDKCIDDRFERLEKALAVLIDSVTKYHPSTVQAEELKAADTELGKGLLEVQAHQNNHLRIQQLRQLSATLDAQIRETLISLATTRRDIVTTQTTTYPSAVDSHAIAYEELLAYARRISKTTMPPSTMTAAAAATSSSPSPEAQTPAPEPQSQLQSQSQQPPSQSQLQPNNGISQPPANNTSLPDGMSQYLNPLSGQVFIPWPLEDKIRSGALASNQVLAEQGIDPRGYDPVLEQDRRRREEEERKEREEREKTERIERERKAREEMERARAERERQREKEQAEWRRASVVGGHSNAAPGPASRAGPGAGEKKQFQFFNLDDMDDDDDDE